MSYVRKTMTFATYQQDKQEFSQQNHALEHSTDHL